MTLNWKKIAFLLVIIGLVSVQAFAQTTTDHQIVGKWEYLSGTWIYFFGDSDVIEFRPNGTAISYEEWEAGNFSISGQQITVVDDYGDTYVFRFSISRNVLTITDEDGDVCRWERWY